MKHLNLYEEFGVEDRVKEHSIVQIGDKHTIVQIGDSSEPMVNSIGIKNGLFYVSVKRYNIGVRDAVLAYEPYEIDVEELKRRFEKIGSVDKFKALVFLKKEAISRPNAEELSWDEIFYGIQNKT